MQIRFFTKEGWQGTKFHFHDQMEILLMMSEGGYFHVRNVIYPITRGSLFVLSPDDLHRSAPRSESLHQFYSIRFYPEDVSGFSSENFDVLSCFLNHERFQFRVQLFIQYSYFHFMLHCLGLLLGKWQFSSPAMETAPQFFSYINRREKKPPWFPMAATTPYSMAMRFFCGSCLCGALGIEMRKMPSSNLADRSSAFT